MKRRFQVPKAKGAQVVVLPPSPSLVVAVCPKSVADFAAVTREKTCKLQHAGAQ